MVRASRIASEVALYACTVSALWPGLSPTIQVPLAVVAFVAVCAAIAFRLHDTTLAGNGVSLRD